MKSRNLGSGREPTQPTLWQAYSTLLASTLAFLVCFVVWMMFGVLGMQLQQEMGLSATEFGLLSATPILTGAAMRLPLGAWTDRFGGRMVMTALLVACALPVYLVGLATQFWQLLLASLALGCVGASFAVGAPYVARFFAPARRGFAMGVFGAGTVGAACNLFVTPMLQAAYGWRAVPRIYAVALLLTAGIFYLASTPDPGLRRSRVPGSSALKLLRDRRVWKLCLYYWVNFGGFTALSLWLPQYVKAEFGMSILAASFFAAGFSLPGSVMRAVGGVLSDRFGARNMTCWSLWAGLLCLLLLSGPTSDLLIHTVDGSTRISLHLPLAAFVGLSCLLGTVLAFGMASTFKYVADDFPHDMGIVTGIVSLVGGLGGFFLPILFGCLVDSSGMRTTCFMLLCAIVGAALALLYMTDRRKSPSGGTEPTEMAV